MIDWGDYHRMSQAFFQNLGPGTCNDGLNGTIPGIPYLITWIKGDYSSKYSLLDASGTWDLA